MASESDLKEDWKRVDRALIPEKLLVEMPQPECKGLTLLTDVMINATVCKLGPRNGQVTAPYSDDIEIVLDVAETIERRLPAPWNGFWNNGHGHHPNRGLEDDRHLETWVRNSKTGANTKVCISATGEGYVPAIDDCVSFVLWAEAGFPYPPPTLDDRILFVRDPEHYEAEKARKKEALRAAQQAESLSKDLTRGKSRAETKALLELELECRRVRNLGWHELIAEHESAGQPTDAVSRALYDLRISLLSIPRPGIQ